MTTVLGHSDIDQGAQLYLCISDSDDVIYMCNLRSHHYTCDFCMHSDIINVRYVSKIILLRCQTMFKDGHEPQILTILCLDVII